MPKKKKELERNLEKIKSDFITIASHRLRTPISAIRWALDTILSKKIGRLTEKQEELLQAAYHNNEYMIKTVNDLLRVARLEEKGVKIISQPTDVVKIVKEIVQKNKDFASAYNCLIKLEVKGEIPQINCDSFQIKPVIQGLVDNAIRYNKKKSKVIITLQKVKNHLLFKIKDSGIGIPKNQQTQVFSKFFRARNAIKAQTEGLGLNLYMAKKIIEGSGGKIWFESIENQGSTFYFTLPISFPLKQKMETPFRGFRKIKEPTIDEDELNYLYRHITDGLIIVDKDLKIIRLNPQAQKFFNLDPKKVIGKNVSRVILNSAFIQALKQPTKDEVSLKVALKDQIPYRVIIFPIKTKGEIEGSVIILHDASKREILTKGVDETLKKEREFVAITVHELKSPLGITKWSLEMLQSENPGKLTKGQRQLINQVYRGNERLLVLVRDLLNLSKLQEGRFEVEPKPVSLEKIAIDTISGFKIQAKGKKLKFNWQLLKKTFPKVLADPGRLGQVIANFVSNAIKYTSRGGEIIFGIKKISGNKLEKISKEILTANILHTKNKNGYLMFWVKDSGIGISKEQQKKIFTKFFRGENVLKSKIEGTGLGLYITKSIVNLHQGDIWFTSILGKGSTFYFTLPII